MGDTCDACHAHAENHWWRAEGQRELTLCDHHNRQHAPALEAAGFRAMTPAGAG